MTTYKLSYVLTTYNKLPYLQHVMRRLVAARQEDEEIVVCDGGSKDGTSAYLQNLYDTGQIQQYVSERDKGEAHGFNKCMLMARGEIIKIITDDDAFHYPSIREGKEFMLNNSNIDALTGDCGLIQLEDLSRISFYSDVENNFNNWLNTGQAVWMIGLPLLIRRKSLALTGLFSTGVVQVDSEFVLRITSLNISMAWSSALLSVRLENPQSNMRLMNEKGGNQASENELQRMFLYYDKFRWIKHEVEPQKTLLTRGILSFKRRLKALISKSNKNSSIEVPSEVLRRSLATNYDSSIKEENVIEKAFELCDNFMDDFNQTNQTKFITKNNELVKIL